MSAPARSARFPFYRVRTWVRTHAPLAVSDRVPKGSRDCGHHRWYMSSERVDHCYHCSVGVRPHEPAAFPFDSPLAGELLAAAEAGNTSSLEYLLRRLEDDRAITAEHLATGMSILERLGGSIAAEAPATRIAAALARRGAALDQLR